MATLQSSPGVTMNLGDLTTEPGGIGIAPVNLQKLISGVKHEQGNRGIGAYEYLRKEQELRRQRNTLCIVGAIVLVTVIAIIIKHKRRK